MKFYLVNGRYVATKAEATGAGGPWERVEIGTDQDSMLALLNAQQPALGISDLVAPAYADTGSGIVIDPKPSASPTQPPARNTKAEAEVTIEEAIADADYPRALALAHHIHHRLMEHGRAAGGGK